jgi:hypothetical protein
MVVGPDAKMTGRLPWVPVMVLKSGVRKLGACSVLVPRGVAVTRVSCTRLRGADRLAFRYLSLRWYWL